MVPPPHRRNKLDKKRKRKREERKRGRETERAPPRLLTGGHNDVGSTMSSSRRLAKKKNKNGPRCRRQKNPKPQRHKPKGLKTKKTNPSKASTPLAQKASRRVEQAKAREGQIFSPRHRLRPKPAGGNQTQNCFRAVVGERGRERERGWRERVTQLTHSLPLSLPHTPTASFCPSQPH